MIPCADCGGSSVVGDLYFSPKGNLLERVQVLVDTLEGFYGKGQKAIIYEAAQYPVCEPRIIKTTIGGILEHRLTGISTLFVPPKQRPVMDREMLAKLKIETAAA